MPALQKEKEGDSKILFIRQHLTQSTSLGTVENFISGPYRKAVLSVNWYILLLKLLGQKYLLAKVTFVGNMHRLPAMNGKVYSHANVSCTVSHTVTCTLWICTTTASSFSQLRELIKNVVTSSGVGFLGVVFCFLGWFFFFAVFLLHWNVL